MDTQAEFLGPLLVEENLLVPEQLDLALKFAESTGLPLDQIVVAEFSVPQPDISRLLARLNGDADVTEDAEAEPPVIVPPVRPLGFRIRRPIGQIFVDLGFITTDDREAALEVQRESGALLGEILVEQGKLTRLELANALSEHWASFTTDVSTPEHKPALTVVPPANGDTPSPGAPDIAELRRSLDELEAARVADAQAAEARLAAIDESLAALVPSDDQEFRQATTERLEELASKVEAAESGSTGAVGLIARLDDLASSTLELRSELEALASRPAEVEPSESANELQQTVDVLAKTLDDRLATLAADVRAENATRTDEIAAKLRAETEELAASIAISRIDDLNETWRADAEAARLANDKLQEKLDELTATRATDVEATQAAHAQATHAAAEAARIEHALRSELEALASLQTEAEQGERVVELKQAIDSVSTQLTALTERVESSRAADAEAAESANAHLRERLDELIALRATDIEATQAAQARAAAETARIEQALRSELEALASLRIDHEPDERVNELSQTVAALTRNIDDRLETIATELRAETERVESARAADAKVVKSAGGQIHRRLDELTALQATDIEAARAAQAQAAHAAAETARMEHALRSELEKLASLQAEADPGQRKQTISALAQRQAETADELTASIATLHETVAATHARSEQNADAWAEACRTLTSRLNDLDQAHRADTDAAELATKQLHRRLDELMALRAADLETIQAAQAHTAAETARIEHGLVGTLGDLAVQLDDIKSQLGRSVPASQPVRVDDEPVADDSDARDPKPGKKRSKQGKGKKKPKH